MTESLEVGTADVTLADLPQLAGRTFAGEWAAVPPGRAALFDSATYVDQNVNPFDESAYPDQLIEGFHLLGLLDQLLGAILRPREQGVLVHNYGLERVRFLSPVEAGDDLRLRCEIESVVGRPGGSWLMSTNCVVELRDRKKPAFVADWLLSWTRSDFAGPGLGP